MTTESAADLAERLYNEGFRRAQITDADGWHVAGVGPHPVGGGARTWWGKR